jgi:hypothetical protein
MDMASRTQLSPRGAVVVGLVCAALGGVIILGALGVLPLRPAPDVADSPWLLACAGLMFVFVGAAVIVGFAVAGGSGPDGDLPVGTLFCVRLIQYLLGLGAVGSMTAVFTWIAFGPGERRFSTTVVLPFMVHRGASDDTSGRVVFGIGAVLLWIFLLSVGVSGARRLFRDARK